MSKPVSVQLTRHSPGSFREALTVCLPLIIGCVSGGLMFFIDRLIVSEYSLHHMNAMLGAGSLAFTFLMIIISIASISEVFVSRRKGEGRHHELGEPVWQMIWFSVIAQILLIPIALIFDGTLPEAYQDIAIPYFHIMIGGGVFFGLTLALMGYYVGRGETRWVMMVFLLGNLINLVLDVLLVFGVTGYLEPQGASGAALATVLAQVSMTVIFAIPFMRRSHRENYGTQMVGLRPKIFLESLRIAGPNAITHTVEMSVLTTVLILISDLSEVHATVASVGQAFFVLFMFITEGITKGATAICGNLIGMNRLDRIQGALRSMFALIFISASVLAVLILTIPDTVAGLFIEEGLTTASYEELIRASVASFPLLWVFYVLDGVLWIYYGLFTAAGDTRYMLFVSLVCQSTFMLGMSILVFFYFGLPAEYFWASPALCTFVMYFAYHWRYRSNRWQAKIRLT